VQRSDFVTMHGLLAGYGLPVPAILDTDGPRGILLLEDLGDGCLQDLVAHGGQEQVRDRYRAAVGQLVRLQLEAERGPRAAACFQLAFDVEKLSFELNFFREHFLEGERACQISATDRGELDRAFERLNLELAGWPRVLCHRDFHSRNLMVCGDRLVWIDFQDARLGPATYDLASLLRDSYVDLHDDLVAELCAEFRAGALPLVAPETFLRCFELMAVQRNLKALGTFGFMHTVRGKAQYLAHVPRTLAYLRHNLSRHAELGALRRVLARHLPELE